MKDGHTAVQSLAQELREGQLTRREFFRTCARLGIGVMAASSVLRTLGGGTASAAALPGPLNILVWDDHFDEPELKDFLATTGVKVNTSLFDENADAYAKTKLVGGRQIDVVSGDALWGPRYYQSGLVDPLDLSQFTSAKELFPVFREISFWKVGTRSIMFPWSWAPIIPYYDPRYVTPFDSYEALFDPKYRRRIVMEKTPVDIMAQMGLVSGAKKPYQMTASEVKAAKEALIRLKPNILTFVEQSNQFVQYFVNGSAWIIANAHTGLDYRVKQAGGPLVKPVYPKEGYVGFLDGEMVVKNAAHRDAAMAWLDHKNQAKYVVVNFQKQLRALANEKAMKILQQDPKYADLVHATGYDQPDVALRMILKGPPPGEGLKMYIDAFNEAIAR